MSFGARFQSPLTNVLKSITPVAAGWNVDPTSLANCTDGDLSTVTGTGTGIVAAAGDYGYLTFDMSSTKTILVAARLGLWSTASTVTCRYGISDDDSTYRETGNAEHYVSSTSEVVREGIADIMTGRYLRLRFKVDAAATAYAKVYEVMAWALTL